MMKNEWLAELAELRVAGKRMRGIVSEEERGSPGRW